MSQIPMHISNVNHIFMIREVLINAYKSVGSSSAWKVLIKKIQENKINEFESMKIFTFMNVGAYDPIMVSELIVST